MAKVAFVNPNYQGGSRKIAQISVGPPLGLAYLAASLEKEAIAACIIDANALQLSDEEIQSQIDRNPPEILALGATTPTVDLCARIAKTAKARRPDMPVVLGGIHASILPEETARNYPMFDYLFCGEAELTLPGFAQSLLEKEPNLETPGLVWRDGDKICINEKPPMNRDLDALPFPARHLLPNDKYRCPDAWPMSCLIGIRGCPAPCIFCAVPTMFGAKLRRRSPDNILDEIEHCRDAYGVKFFSFLDDTFSFHAKWVYELCEKFVARGLPKQVKWICLTRADIVDEKLLCAMKEAGCVRVEFGIESGSQDILDALKKGANIGHIRNAFATAKKVGLSTMGFVMFNSPRETVETIAATKKFVLEIDPDYLQVSFVTPYPGTTLAAEAEKEGLIKTKDWSQYIFLRNIILRNRNLTEDRLLEEVRAFNRAFFLRPKYILRILRMFLRTKGNLKTLAWAGANALKMAIAK